MEEDPQTDLRFELHLHESFSGRRPSGQRRPHWIFSVNPIESIYRKQNEAFEEKKVQEVLGLTRCSGSSLQSVAISGAFKVFWNSVGTLVKKHRMVQNKPDGRFQNGSGSESQRTLKALKWEPEKWNESGGTSAIGNHVAAELHLRHLQLIWEKM